MKKFCFILALLMLLSSFAGCKKEEESKGGSDGRFTEADGELYEDVPVQSLSGTFHILCAETDSPASAFTAEELDGNNLNEAIYRRQTNVEERLSITITEERLPAEKAYNQAVQSILADEDLYDTVSLPLSYAASLAANGYLYNMNSLPAIDTEKPWWNMTLTKEAAVGENYYYLFGDIQQDMRDAYTVVCVNMELAAETKGLGDPYAIVDSGKWTVDKMLEMMQMVAGDKDGNGILDTSDTYGAAFSSDVSLALLSGMGQSLFTKEKGSIFPISNFNTEPMLDADKKRQTLIEDKSTYYQEKMELTLEDAKSARAMFKDGKALFYITTVGNLYSLRETDWEIGLLPMPKARENQKEYTSLLPADLASVVCVPKISREPKRVSIILENLAAESYRKEGVADCYLNTVLQFRYMNDEASRKNLDLVLSNGTVDLGNIYNWGGISDIAKNSFGSDYLGSITKYKNKIENEMLDTIAELEIEIVY